MNVAFVDFLDSKKVSKELRGFDQVERRDNSILFIWLNESKDDLKSILEIPYHQIEGISFENEEG